MPARKKSAGQDVTRRVIQWRDEVAVLNEANKMADKEGVSNNTMFSELFRLGIGTYSIAGDVRKHLCDLREKQIQELEDTDNEWALNEAKSRRMMFNLYAPSDLEVMDFIRMAVREKIGGKVDRDALLADAAARGVPQRETPHSPVPEGAKIRKGSVPIDTSTIVVDIGSEVMEMATTDTISVSLRMPDGSTYENAVLSENCVMFQYTNSAEEKLIADKASISIQGDVAFTFSFQETSFGIYRSLLSPETGEYGNMELLRAFSDAHFPSAIVVKWLDYALLIDEKGCSYYQGDHEMIGGYEPKYYETVVRYAGYALVIRDGQDGVLVLDAETGKRESRRDHTLPAKDAPKTRGRRTGVASRKRKKKGEEMLGEPMASEGQDDSETMIGGAEEATE